MKSHLRKTGEKAGEKTVEKTTGKTVVRFMRWITAGNEYRSPARKPSLPSRV
jgi:hypothetical protein